MNEHKSRSILFTAESAPVGANVCQFLDRLQAKIGGKRGYGGKLYSGHWLLCRPAWRNSRKFH